MSAEISEHADGKRPGPAHGLEATYRCRMPLSMPPCDPSRLLASTPVPGSPAAAALGRSARGKVSLIYDAVLDCYFDPKTNNYFELC